MCSKMCVCTLACASDLLLLLGNMQYACVCVRDCQTYSIFLLQVGEMKVPVYHSQEIQPVFVHPVPGYGGHLEVLLTFFPLS